MKKIAIKDSSKKVFYCLIDDEDYPVMSSFKWIAEKSHGNVYARKGKSKRCDYRSMHRKLMNALGHQIVDHINRNSLDNRKSNLRFVTPSQNAVNRKKKKSGYTSMYLGVFYADRNRPSKWCAMIGSNGEQKTIGYFKSEKEAALAYDKQATIIHKQFATLNFPHERKSIAENNNQSPEL